MGPHAARGPPVGHACLRASPKLFALYQMAINYYEAMSMDIYTDERIAD